jgi:hypothetical protein
MSEEKIVEVVNEALASAGIEDTVTAAGEFEPRGHSGAGFAGGLIGGDIGDAIGSPAGGIGAAGGYLAGTRAHDTATGLPGRMVVGVSETTVYGFAGNRAHPQALVFRVPRVKPGFYVAPLACEELYCRPSGLLPAGPFPGGFRILAP